jgi:UPF0755 protein
MTQRRSRAILSFFLFFLIFALAAGFALRWLEAWLQEPRVLQSPVELVIAKGSSGQEIVDQLAERGLIDHRLVFYLWARHGQVLQKYQAGRYRFADQFTIQQVSQALVNGDVYRELMLQVTIPEGFTAKEIFDRLSALGLARAELERNFADPGFLSQAGLKAPNLEGYLYPATYTFYDVMPEAKQILKLMVDRFFAVVTPELIQRLAAVGLSLNEAVTFASLIEHETSFDEEKPLVAEVIWNRLKRKMPLGIDAALIYGIADYAGDIKWVHLRDAKNPYNTRIHKGLPPGPIGSPHISSLLAILNPSQEGYYYYVLDKELSGRHRFTKTLKEHNLYVEKLKRNK